MEVKIWGVTEGPIGIDEVSDEDLEYAPEGSKYFMVCRTEIDGEINEDAAWYYGEPKPAAEEIKGRIAFWRGVKVEA